MRVCARAPAKVNLDLRVLGRREDGYHELSTLIQSIDLADEVCATEAPEGVLELEVEPRGVVPTDRTNLVLQAASALIKNTGVAAGARFELHKRIPIGAGLGGGSADAAAALVLLDRLWGLHLEATELADLAAGLGSDVPFFLCGGLVRAVGRGEVLRPLPDLPEHGVVVCTPPLEVSTARVYGRLTPDRPDGTVDPLAGAPSDGGELAPRWSEYRNDLEAVVVEGWPIVGRVVSELRTTDPLLAAVTGSGGAAFAVFSEMEAAHDAAQSLSERWRVDVVSTLSRDNGRVRVREEDRE